MTYFSWRLQVMMRFQGTSVRGSGCFLLWLTRSGLKSLSTHSNGSPMRIVGSSPQYLPRGKYLSLFSALTASYTHFLYILYILSRNGGMRFACQVYRPTPMPLTHPHPWPDLLMALIFRFWCPQLFPLQLQNNRHPTFRRLAFWACGKALLIQYGMNC